MPIVLQTFNDIISVQNSSQSFSISIQIATHDWEVLREFFEHASTSYLIDWIGSRNIDKHMPFRQYATSNAYSCCPLWPFWSRLSIWIYQPLTESCPETIMIWWNNEQLLPFHQCNTAYWLRFSQMPVNSLFNLFLCMIVTFFLHVL